MSSVGYTFTFVEENSKIPDHLISVREAANLLSLTDQRVRQLLKQNELHGEQVGRSWVVDHASLVAFRESRGLSTILPESASPRGSRKKLKVLSFFSGAMGLDLGLERAGLEVVLACEFDKASRATIAANKPGIPVLGDIWQYDAAQIRELAGLGENDEIDVVAGGPPCQAFSTAGARRGFTDARGNVFLRYIELIRELRPRYAVLENVRGLLSMPVREAAEGEEPDPLASDLGDYRGGAIIYAVRLLEAAGYTVSFNLYNSANYGSAQVRERVVVICTRDGERVPYLKPTHSSDPAFGLPAWRTFRDVTQDLNEVEHHHINFPESRIKYFRMLGPGQYWKHLPVDLQKEALGKSYYLTGGRTGFLRRLSWDKPSPTLVTHPAMPATDLGHPEFDRPLSIEEYKRVQEFPDDWHIRGSLQDQYKQIGNAVPLSLGAAIGRAIVEHAAGRTWDEPAGFAYSRYRQTSDREIVTSRRDAEVTASA
jgi:DNA (cytosine-5)-methyltransferase 1